MKINIYIELNRMNRMRNIQIDIKKIFQYLNLVNVWPR